MSFLLRFFTVFLTHGALLASSPAFSGDITQAAFDDVVRKIETHYQPIVARHGQTLVVEADWHNPEPNAHSQQDEGSTNWRTIVYGGLARRPEMTLDAFTLTLCHEIGHHLAGYPMYVGDWGMINSLSSEGQSDYYATQACLRALWKEEDNAVDTTGIPPSILQACQAVWKNQDERNLCHRIVLAGKAAAETWAAGEGTTVSLQTKDPYVTPDTNHNFYPSAQCRLDTYVAGALCPTTFDDDVIPGRLDPNGQESDGAFAQAMRQSCSKGEGKRPACWFNPNRDFQSSTLLRR